MAAVDIYTNVLADLNSEVWYRIPMYMYNVGLQEILPVVKQTTNYKLLNLFFYLHLWLYNKAREKSIQFLRLFQLRNDAGGWLFIIFFIFWGVAITNHTHLPPTSCKKSLSYSLAIKEAVLRSQMSARVARLMLKQPAKKIKQ